MLEQILRPRLDRIFFNPCARVLQRVSFFSPNRITIISLITGALAALAIAFNHIMPALLFLCLSGLADILDGTLARISNASSQWGSVLDIMSDRFVEAALLVGFYWQAPGRGLICLLMLASVFVCVTSFLLAAVVVDAEPAKSFYYSPGLIERPEAFGFFAAMIVFPAAFNVLGAVFVVLVVVTTVVRLFEIAKQTTFD
jgi:phosphatidylglycerophosphate synthase